MMSPSLSALEADIIGLFVQISRVLGQRSIEIGITGARDLAQAEASLRNELPRLIDMTPRFGANGRDSEFVVGALAPPLKPVPPTCRR